MNRSKTAAVLGLLVLAAASGSAALCGLMACGERSGPAACHPVETGSTRLTDCCAAHAPAGAQREIALDATSLARVTTLVAWSEVARPELARPMPLELLFDPPDARGGPVALFTLHRSLLL